LNPQPPQRQINSILPTASSLLLGLAAGAIGARVFPHDAAIIAPVIDGGTTFGTFKLLTSESGRRFILSSPISVRHAVAWVRNEKRGSRLPDDLSIADVFNFGIEVESTTR